MSKQEMTNNFNDPVVKQTPMVREGQSSGGSSAPFDHSGTLKETASGKQWLEHKTPGGSPSNDTVITDAKNMSSAWKEAAPSTKSAEGTTVGSTMDQGNYSLFGGNCHDATVATNPNVEKNTLGTSIQEKK